MTGKLQHFFLPNDFRKSDSYISTKKGGSKKKDNWGGDRESHGKKLLFEFDESLKNQLILSKNFYEKDDIGSIIEIEIEPNFESVLKSLDSIKKGIQLLSIRKDKDTNIIYAKIFIEHNKTEYLKNKIIDYLNPTKPKNKTLMESIKSINRAILKSFWTDDIKLLPNDNSLTKWELWLRVIEHEEIEKIKSICNSYGIETQENKYIKFFDRSVIVVLANIEQINKLLESTDRIAELRKSKETADFFLRLPTIDQSDWSNDLIKRTKKSKDINTSICILDTGVNNQHPLIKNFLKNTDLHSYNQNWIPNDQVGHGTNMAGICLYGDLTKVLQLKNNVDIKYNLESVKILDNNNPNNIDSYGYVTTESVSRVEIENSSLKRVFCMAVTSENSNYGKPSSWSSSIDKITSGQDDNGYKRLFIISAGNIPSTKIKSNTYTSLNETEAIHDPCQSWNSLVVGAYTEYNDISSLNPILAPIGDLSPVSTTSLIWNDYWVNKPDIVMEGGNCEIISQNNVSFENSLSLLTTHHKIITGRLFATFGDTSASTALASQMAAIIWSEYPNLRAETVRALIIHSASWTPAMILRANEKPQKSKNLKNTYLLRCYGYGVPDLEKALWSLKNQLTIIVEDSIKPFKKEIVIKNGKKNTKIMMNEIHFYDLPIPKNIIQEYLSEADLEMRITLSYFIEPCPGERGKFSKHRYSSHGLRFEVKSPTETKENFQKRLNKLARIEDENVDSGTDNNKWFLGSNLRSKGSIHSDIWKGSGAQLADKDYIAVYPVTGWWKEKPELEHLEMNADYSLIITIKTEKTEIDIYSYVKHIITAKSKVQIEI